ncbi:MAG: 50S ribosomal protein L19e [Candidatus Micrarchaeia archaeon]
MSIRFVKRIASDIIGRGESAIRIKPSAMDDAKKAITRDDIRKLIQNGSIFAVQPKHNISMNSKILKKKRAEGRRRGPGRRKGSRKARGGISWEKRVRAQRMLLKELKNEGKIDTRNFGKFYALIKGNMFPNKASLILHIRDSGIQITDEEIAKVEEAIRNSYR